MEKAPSVTMLCNYIDREGIFKIVRFLLWTAIQYFLLTIYKSFSKSIYQQELSCQPTIIDEWPAPLKKWLMKYAKRRVLEHINEAS